MVDLLDLSLTDEHTTAIGLVTARHSYLDSYVEVAIWRFLAVGEPLGRAVTSDLTASSRLSLLRSLANERMDSSSKESIEFERILGRIQLANEERNAVVHADFSLMSYSLNQTVSRYSARRKVKVTQKHLPLEEMQAIAERIGEVNNDLFSFLIAHRKARFFAPVEPFQVGMKVVEE